MNDDPSRNNWFAGLLVTAFIFLILGYMWRYVQEPLHYEQAEVDGLVGELTVIARGEICGEGP